VKMTAAGSALERNVIRCRITIAGDLALGYQVSTVVTAPENMKTIRVGKFSPFALRGWLQLSKTLGPLAIAILAVVSAGKIFETRDAGSALSSAVNTATFFRLILLGIAGAIISPGLVKFSYPRSTPFVAFFFYVLICVASAAWSASTITTIGKALELLVGWLVICFVASGDNGPDRLRAAARLVLYFMAVQVVVITGLYLGRIPGFFERGAGGLSELLGARSSAPFISANSIGYFSATLLVCVAGLRFSKLISLQRAIFLGSVFAITLICSGSRTALAMAVAGAGFHWTMCRHPSVRGFVFIVAGVSGMLAVGPVIEFMQGDVSDDVFYSLSGRTWLWEKAIEAYASNPFIGYGYGVGSRVAFSLLGSHPPSIPQGR
jgi:O-antigen ligase